MKSLRISCVLVALYGGWLEAQQFAPPIPCPAAVSINSDYIINGTDSVATLICNPDSRVLWEIENASLKDLWVGFGHFKIRGGGAEKDPVNDGGAKQKFYVFRVRPGTLVSTNRLRIDKASPTEKYKYDIRIWTSRPDNTYGGFVKELDPDLDVTPPPTPIGRGGRGGR